MPRTFKHEAVLAVTLPTTAWGVAILITLAVPGFSYLAVRIAFAGYFEQDRDLPGRLSSAIFISVLLDSIYLLTFGSFVFKGLSATKDLVTIQNPWLVGLSVLLFALVLPALLAVVVRLPYRALWKPNGQQRWHIVWTHLNKRGRNSLPQAWDFAGNANRAGAWVRVRKSDGYWYGGWYSTGSAMSAFPSTTRDLYIAHQYAISNTGVFGSKIESTRGIWLAVKDGDVVQWLNEQEESES